MSTRMPRQSGVEYVELLGGGILSDLSEPAGPLHDGVDVLWLTAGLGCDGESIALTAATQPAVEDLRAGTLPGVPPLRIHNPVFAYEVGDQFVDRFHRAARGEIDPFILVVEGSIPDETNKPEGYWATFGTDRATGQPS